MLFHLCSSTLFIHSHIIDGNKITHSHIFAGPVTEHSHTSSSADSIDRATYFDAEVVVATSLDNPIFYSLAEYLLHADIEVITRIVSTSLRAPPALA